jgi:hypothetical protein
MAISYEQMVCVMFWMLKRVNLPIEGPYDCGEEDRCLQQMLENYTGPIVFYPSFLECKRKRNT